MFAAAAKWLPAESESQQQQSVLPPSLEASGFGAKPPTSADPACCNVSGLLAKAKLGKPHLWEL